MRAAASISTICRRGRPSSNRSSRRSTPAPPPTTVCDSRRHSVCDEIPAAATAAHAGRVVIGRMIPAGAKIIFDPNAVERQRLYRRGFLCSFAGRKIRRRCAFRKRIRRQLGSRLRSRHRQRTARRSASRQLCDRRREPGMEGATAPVSTTPAYPQGNERPPEDANFYQQVYFHRLGTDPKQDTYVIGKEFPPHRRNPVARSDDGQVADRRRWQRRWRRVRALRHGRSGHWTQVTHFADGIVVRQTRPGRRPLPALPQKRAARPDPAPAAGASRSRRCQGHRSAKFRLGGRRKCPRFD